MPDSPFPDAPDDFDDATELVKGWAGAQSKAKLSGATPEDFEDEPAAWDEDEATAVVSATDIGGFFGERFRVDARLGIGAMGRVLTAVDMKTGTLVALKVLHKDRAKDAAVVERFQREAAVLREIRHPAIVRLVAFDRSRDGTWWLAMEHLVGKTLKDRLSHGGPFAPRDAWPVLATVCDGVATAHAQGILHRDLKPENVLLLESGLPPCKILDFGLSRYTAKPDRLTATGTVLGTPGYMAPEVLAEHGTIDERADVFAIGAIAFEMLTGRSIYPADDFGQLFGCILEGRVLSLRSVRPDAPPALDRLLADALAKDVSARIPTAEAFARLFAQAVGVSEDRSVFLPAAARAVEPGSGIRDTARDLSPLARGARPAPAPPRPRPAPPTVLGTPPAAPAPRPMPAAPVAAPTVPEPSVSAPAPAAATPITNLPSPGPFHPPTPAAPIAAHSPPTPFTPPPAAPESGRYPGIAPPANFTRPVRVPTVPTSSARPSAGSWALWLVLFVLAAAVTMATAGGLAYAIRVWLAR